MFAEADYTSDVLATAGLLERWVDEVPRWDPYTSERWSVFASRHDVAERALEERLHHLPGCELWWSTTSTEVALTLAGLRIRSRAGLGGACRAWAAEIRRRTAS